MKELRFKTYREFREWNEKNDIYPFYKTSDLKMPYYILQDEVDELLSYGEKSGSPIIELDNGKVFLKCNLTHEQYDKFRDAHCTTLYIEYYHKETIALISADCWDKIYSCLGDWSATAEEIISLAERFESRNDWFIFGDAGDYIDLLERFENEVMKDYKTDD